MPPVISYPKETILQAAFDLCRDFGPEQITARGVAVKLGCSVAPIYSNFRNLEELKKAIMEKTLDILLEYTRKQYSENVFLNIGLGILAFARDYPVPYRTLFLSGREYSGLIEELFQENLRQMRKEESLKELNDTELKRVLEKTRLFTHGLAVFLCSGNLPDPSDEYIVRLMKETGEDIFGYTLYKKRMGANIQGEKGSKKRIHSQPGRDETGTRL